MTYGRCPDSGIILKRNKDNNNLVKSPKLNNNFRNCYFR
jgi:hypothetical protein